MDSMDSLRLLADSVAPLVEKYGSRLSLAREMNCVQWSFEGNAAIVEFQLGEGLCATFVSAPVIDGVSARPVSAIYRARTNRYRLNSKGSQEMVSDMLAFFSGVREPRFSFVNAYSPT